MLPKGLTFFCFGHSHSFPLAMKFSEYNNSHKGMNPFYLNDTMATLRTYYVFSLTTGKINLKEVVCFIQHFILWDVLDIAAYVDH